MSKGKELYNILGVSPNASHQAIHDQYWTIIKETEPEVYEKNKKAAVAGITEAYNILNDPALRRIYDVEGLQGINPSQGQSSCCTSIANTFRYYYYDLSHDSKTATEWQPLLVKKQRSGCCSCLYTAFLWIIAIILIAFIFAAISYVVLQEE